MIKQIVINKYKKLENMTFDFSPGLNVISGTNGTCKTTLLHIISNVFKSVKVTSDNYINPSCVRIIKQNNVFINPKIESLVRDANNYTDPAKGMKGELFEVNYSNGTSLKFRKHNSEKDHRYAIKPPYTTGGQSLPFINIIYLSLSRLFPVGEAEDDELQDIRLKLPEEYISMLSDIYTKLTHIEIKNVQVRKINEFKSGPEFGSTVEGIDSNTISSGEDNIFIILKALVSLAYYHDSLNEKDDHNVSILLIDEFDATLHPSLQDKLYDIISSFSQKYKIQVFITTHSLSLLEYVIQKKDNLIYLLNNITHVHQIEKPTIIDIKMHLKTETRSQIYNKKKIPIFTEDDQARVFLNEIFDYFEKLNDDFSKIRRFLHLVECKVGADNLVTIFNDVSLIETTVKSICVLDGDKNTNINRCLLKLPGNLSPEVICFKYIEELNRNDDKSFWADRTIIDLGYTKSKYLSDIRSDIISIDSKIEKVREITGTAKGVPRQLNKDVFDKHREFFELVFRHWIANEQNKIEINSFYNNLRVTFHKVSAANGIFAEEWPFGMPIVKNIL